VTQFVQIDRKLKYTGIAAGFDEHRITVGCLPVKPRGTAEVWREDAPLESSGSLSRVQGCIAE
jgi:hypothetical protein